MRLQSGSTQHVGRVGRSRTLQLDRCHDRICSSRRRLDHVARPTPPDSGMFGSGDTGWARTAVAMGGQSRTPSHTLWMMHVATIPIEPGRQRVSRPTSPASGTVPHVLPKLLSSHPTASFLRSELERVQCQRNELTTRPRSSGLISTSRVFEPSAGPTILWLSRGPSACPLGEAESQFALQHRR